MKLQNLRDAISNGEGVERPFRCDVHEDTNASASVNVDKGVWCCYACGAGGKTDAGKVTKSVEQIIREMRSDDNPVIYPNQWLNVFNSAGSNGYWADRYGLDIATKYSCGVDPMTGCPTYPIHDKQGRVRGVVQRQDKEPKYIYPAKVQVSHHLFGYHLINKKIERLVIVEGASDVMALETAQKRSPNTVAVGCYGAGLKKPQVDLINQLMPLEVLLAFDNDKAGKLANEREYALLSPVRVWEWNKTTNDPGDASMREKEKVMTWKI